MDTTSEVGILAGRDMSGALLWPIPLTLCAAILVACAAPPSPHPEDPGALRNELDRLGADLGAAVPIPFEVGPEAIAQARREVARAPRGRERIERLVALLTLAPPEGFGLRYRWSRTATAREALALGEGNCLTLASVLVGLARGIGWRAFYAEAGDPRAEEGVLADDLGVLADHMVVVLVTERERAVVDFLGTVEGRALRLIDDFAATAHFLNNRGFERVVEAQAGGLPIPWEEVARDFELATRVAPDFARAWNNLGLALSRVGRNREARLAYVRARMLDAGLGSPERNLRALRTRLSGDAAPAIESLPEGPTPTP